VSSCCSLEELEKRVPGGDIPTLVTGIVST
jgi:hypothetical protein